MLWSSFFGGSIFPFISFLISGLSQPYTTSKKNNKKKLKLGFFFASTQAQRQSCRFSNKTFSSK